MSRVARAWESPGDRVGSGWAKRWNWRGSCEVRGRAARGVPREAREGAARVVRGADVVREGASSLGALRRRASGRSVREVVGCRRRRGRCGAVSLEPAVAVAGDAADRARRPGGLFADGRGGYVAVYTAAGCVHGVDWAAAGRCGGDAGGRLWLAARGGPARARQRAVSRSGDRGVAAGGSPAGGPAGLSREVRDGGHAGPGRVDRRRA